QDLYPVKGNDAGESSPPDRVKLMSVGRLTTLVALLLVTPAISQPSFPRPPTSAAPPDDGQWTMPAKNYASSRCSELDEINADNVKQLQVAFTISTGVNKGHEAAPLIVGQTMFIVSPYPNVLYALDLAQPG